MKDRFSLLTWMPLTCAAMLLCCMLFVGLDAAARDYDVYILAGQSNMDGRGNTADLDKPFAAPQTGTLIYYTNPANPDKERETKVSSGWTELAPGYSIGPGAREKGLRSKTFGPEVSFASAIAKAVPSDNPIAIIKIARGGTNLHTDWAPDGYMYKALLAEIRVAMNLLEADGRHTATIRGVVWHQGESDAGHERKHPGSYRDNLGELIVNIRKALKDDDLPFVIGELAQTKPKAFREMQRKIAADNKHVGFTSSAGLGVIGGPKNDQTHFNADAQITFGKRYAQTLATLVPKASSLGFLDNQTVCLSRKR